MTALLWCSSEATFTDQTSRSEKQPCFKSITSIIGHQGGEEMLFACPTVGQRSGLHTELHLLSWYWRDFLEYCATSILQENSHLNISSRTACAFHCISKERRDVTGGVRVKLSGMSRMEEVRRRAHLMNLLREAEGWSERCVKLTFVLSVCVCVCLMLQSCKAAAGEGCPLRTTAAG